MFDGFKKYAPGTLDFVAGVVTQATAPGGIPSSPASASAPADQPRLQAAATPDTLALLLQALQQRQVPPLPAYRAVAQRAPVTPQQQALDLLSVILTNPHLQQTLQAGRTTGLPSRTVELPVPAATAPVRTRPVPIPLGAVMNAIVALAGQSMSELNESTPEDDPEVPAYLVGDNGDFLVDPGSPGDRAALVAHLFRLNDEVQHAGSLQPAGPSDEIDESDAWAEEAGFMRARTL